MATNLLEKVVQIPSATPLAIKIKQQALYILGNLWRCRAKPKLCLSEQVEKIMTTINVYLTVVKPRSFDADDLERDIPLEELA